MVHLTVNLSARDLFRGSPEFAPFQARPGAACARIGSPAAKFLSDTTAAILQALPGTRAKRTCRIATHMARLRFGKAYLDDQRVPSEDGCEAIRQCSGVISTLQKYIASSPTSDSQMKIRMRTISDQRIKRGRKKTAPAAILILLAPRAGELQARLASP